MGQKKYINNQDSGTNEEPYEYYSGDDEVINEQDIEDAILSGHDKEEKFREKNKIK